MCPGSRSSRRDVPFGDFDSCGGMKTEKHPSRFALCLRNEGADDLELRKVYQVLADSSASSEGLLRVIDESGEDYLYPAEYFLALRLPSAVARGLISPHQREVHVGARRVRRG
jgi:hypothetical protein